MVEIIIIIITDNNLGRIGFSQFSQQGNIGETFKLLKIILIYLDTHIVIICSKWFYSLCNLTYHQSEMFSIESQ